VCIEFLKRGNRSISVKNKLRGDYRFLQYRVPNTITACLPADGGGGGGCGCGGVIPAVNPYPDTSRCSDKMRIPPCWWSLPAQAFICTRKGRRREDNHIPSASFAHPLSTHWLTVWLTNYVLYCLFSSIPPSLLPYNTTYRRHRCSWCTVHSRIAQIDRRGSLLMVIPLYSTHLNKQRKKQNIDANVRKHKSDAIVCCFFFFFSAALKMMKRKWRLP